MAEDLYTAWLRIPPGPRPPDFYTLLGIARTCVDADLIDAAATVQLDRLDRRALHPDPALRAECQRMMNEVARARTVLVSPEQRAAYDSMIPAPQPEAPIPIPLAATPVEAPAHESPPEGDADATLEELARAFQGKARERSAGGPWKRYAPFALLAAIVVAGLVVVAILLHPKPPPRLAENPANSPSAESQSPPPPISTSRPAIAAIPSPPAVRPAPAPPPPPPAVHVPPASAPPPKPETAQASSIFTLPPAVNPEPRPTPKPAPANVPSPAPAGDVQGLFTVTTEQSGPTMRPDRDDWEVEALQPVDDSTSYAMSYPYVAWTESQSLIIHDLGTGKRIHIESAQQQRLTLPQTDGHSVAFISDHCLYSYDLATGKFTRLCDRQCTQFSLCAGTIAYVQDTTVFMSALDGSRKKEIQDNTFRKLNLCITDNLVCWVEFHAPTRAQIMVLDRATGLIAPWSADSSPEWSVRASGKSVVWATNNPSQVQYRTMNIPGVTTLSLVGRQIVVGLDMCASGFAYGAFTPYPKLQIAICRYDFKQHRLSHLFQAKELAPYAALSDSRTAWRQSVKIAHSSTNLKTRWLVVVDHDGNLQALPHPTIVPSVPQFSGDCIAWLGADVDDQGQQGSPAIWVALPPNTHSGS